MSSEVIVHKASVRVPDAIESVVQPWPVEDAYPEADDLAIQPAPVAGQARLSVAASGSALEPDQPTTVAEQSRPVPDSSYSPLAG